MGNFCPLKMALESWVELLSSALKVGQLRTKIKKEGANFQEWDIKGISTNENYQTLTSAGIQTLKPFDIMHLKPPPNRLHQMNRTHPIHTYIYIYTYAYIYIYAY